ncbi:hypothetical protein [Butyrivibrio proteoclasticus]|nr:hypothetical protein [Butyrivibrio proteoclasticus]
MILSSADDAFETLVMTWISIMSINFCVHFHRQLMIVYTRKIRIGGTMGKLEKIECETIVNWNKEEPFAVVYTRDKDVMKKLDQMCRRYPDTYELTKETDIDKYYQIPKGYVRFHNPDQNSCKARKDASRRMKEMNRKRWNKNS